MALLAGMASFRGSNHDDRMHPAKNPPQPRLSEQLNTNRRERICKEIVIVPQGTQALVSMTDDTHWNTFYSGKWNCFKGVFLNGRT